MDIKNINFIGNFRLLLKLQFFHSQSYSMNKDFKFFETEAAIEQAREHAAGEGVDSAKGYLRLVLGNR